MKSLLDKHAWERHSIEVHSTKTQFKVIIFNLPISSFLFYRTCGGGISWQQRRCRRKPCKGRVWTTKYKICNPEVSVFINITHPKRLILICVLSDILIRGVNIILKITRPRCFYIFDIIKLNINILVKMNRIKLKQ